MFKSDLITHRTRVDISTFQKIFFHPICFQSMPWNRTVVFRQNLSNISCFKVNVFVCSSIIPLLAYWVTTTLIYLFTFMVIFRYDVRYFSANQRRQKHSPQVSAKMKLFIAILKNSNGNSPIWCIYMHDDNIAWIPKSSHILHKHAEEQ